MGTRSLTTFIQVGVDSETDKKWKNKIVTMYRQFDGYPEGMGVDLAEFLNSGKIVNGIGMAEKQLVFNGAGCLTAQAVAHFKDGPGGIYLYRGGTTDCWEEWRYEVLIDEQKQTITLNVKEVGYMNKKDKYCKGTRTVFTGTPQEFLNSTLVNA